MHLSLLNDFDGTVYLVCEQEDRRSRSRSRSRSRQVRAGGSRNKLSGSTGGFKGGQRGHGSYLSKGWEGANFSRVGYPEGVGVGLTSVDQCENVGGAYVSVRRG
eukprot:753154-Hanusia_phi.AAC.11